MSARRSPSTAPVLEPSDQHESPAEPGLMDAYLAPPRGSQVSTPELMREVEEYFLLGAAVSPGDTIIDVGANVGAFALRAAQICKSDLTILCFEPSPGTFEALRSS